MKKVFRRISEMISRFVEGNGFALLVTVCIAVIVGTAVWANGENASSAAPTPPVLEYRSAAGLLQQSLSELPSPTPLPAKVQLQWQAPLASFEVLSPFSNDKMRQSGTTGIWALHQGIDLASAYGDPVHAAADGTIIDCGISNLNGAYAVISHGEGYESIYTGMAALGAVQINDRIKGGQTIGFAGDGPLDESDAGSHIHFAIRKEGAYVDPLPFLE